MFDEAKIKRAVTDIIEAIGEDPGREGLRKTPTRVAEMYAELFAGVKKDPKEVLDVGFELGHREMVILKDIPFYSMCEHHLLPFYGVAHIGYIPNIEGRIIGISKLARVVETIARRPQVQERMTTEIADAIDEGIKPAGVAVVLHAHSPQGRLPQQAGQPSRVLLTGSGEVVLDIQIRTLGMCLDKGFAGGDFSTHQYVEYLIRLGGIIHVHFKNGAGIRAHGGFP